MTGPVEITALFKAYSWQVEPWLCIDPLLLLTGSAGGGKSRLAAEKVHGFLKRYPEAMGVAIRKTRQSMTNSTVLFLEHEVIGDDKTVNHVSSKNRFEYANGSILAYGGMADEEQREQIRSIGLAGGLDIAWMEEANKFTEDDLNELRARMRGRAAPWTQIILSTNPDAPSHWIYRRLILGGEAKVFYSSAIDNPANPPEYIDALKSLTGVLGQRLRDGKWIQAEGAIYDGFDPALHLVDRFAIPDDWRRFRTVDFGYTNPFVCQWWAVDPDGRLWMYREIYHTQRLVEDCAKQIVELSQGERIEATICDHDAEDRATLQKYGVPTGAARKDVSPGIQAVAGRLRKAGDGKPRLFILRGSLVEVDRALERTRRPTCTEEEFAAYVYQQTKEGKPMKEEPLKENDHGMDAMRYGVMYLERRYAPTAYVSAKKPQERAA